MLKLLWCVQGSSLAHLTALRRLTARMAMDVAEDINSICLEGLPASLKVLEASGDEALLAIVDTPDWTGSSQPQLLEPQLLVPLRCLHLVGYAVRLPAKPLKLPMGCHVTLQAGSLHLDVPDQTLALGHSLQLAVQLLAAWVADCGVATVTIVPFFDKPALTFTLHTPGLPAPHAGLACDELADLAVMLASPCHQRGYLCRTSPECMELVITRAT